jgi:hypothetical protein
MLIHFCILLDFFYELYYDARIQERQARKSLSIDVYWFDILLINFVFAWLVDLFGEWLTRYFLC